MNETNQVFEASLFHPSFGNEVVQGVISVDRFAVRFSAESVSESIATKDVVIEKEGRDGPICFYDSNRPELKILTQDTSILQAWSRVPANNVRQQMKELAQRGEFSRALRVTLYVLAGCIVIAFLGSWATGAMVKSLARRVPPEWEKKFGDEEIEKLEAKKSLVEDSNQVAQLAALAKPLLRVVGGSNTEFKFHIVQDAIPNAFAMPGGHIVVNTGLLNMTDRPEELLGVLAHELAHVKQRHVERKIISAAGPLVIFGIFLHSRSGLLNLLTEGSGLMVFQGFSQEFETEADDVGWDYLVKANIDPRGMIEMFQKLKAFEAKLKMTDSLPQAFSSHPALDKRIARLEKKWRRLDHKTGFLQITNKIPKFKPDQTQTQIPALR